VLSSYNHSRNDEEVYKEFLEIANDIIPQILRMEHAGGLLTRDPIAYALLLRFYDGLCCWEEDSQTPVLHITWATHMLSSIGKFDSEARTAVEILNHGGDANTSAVSDTTAEQKVSVLAVNDGGNPRQHNLRTHRRSDPVNGKSHLVPSIGKPQSPDSGVGGLQVAAVEFSESGGSSEVSPVGMDTQLAPPPSDKLKINLDQLARQSDENDDSDDGVRRREIDALAHACSESLLNPDFLRGSGEPFVKDLNHQLLSSATSTQMDLSAFVASADSDLSSVGDISIRVTDSTAAYDSGQRPSLDSSVDQRPRLVLQSAKMSALRQLLVAPKLNSSAIKLHLTAQSQVARKPSAHVRRPLSAQFYSDDRHLRAVKRRRRDDD